MDFPSLNKWSPPSSWQKITVIDAHIADEPLRSLRTAFPVLWEKDS